MIETRAGFTGAIVEDRVLEGIAVPYGSASRVLRDRPRPYREVFERGALEWDDETVGLWGHDPSGVPIARVGAGTLSLQESDAGLRFRMTLPKSRSDLIEALERRDLSGAVSIGFILREGGDVWNHRLSPSLRKVRRASLVEISVVQVGAYEGATGVLK